MGDRVVEEAIDLACGDLTSWLGELPEWENAPWAGDSRGYRGPTLLGEADCRMHLVRLLARHIEPEWLHQEVPASAYLFPLAEVKRSWRIDIGIVDPRRLSSSLTAEQMQAVRWNALIEVKFRGNSPGYEFAAANPADIGYDLQKLEKFLPFCDRAYAVVIEEVPALSDAEIKEIAALAPEIELRFLNPKAEEIRETREGSGPRPEDRPNKFVWQDGDVQVVRGQSKDSPPADETDRTPFAIFYDESLSLSEKERLLRRFEGSDNWSEALGYLGSISNIKRWKES